MGNITLLICLLCNSVSAMRLHRSSSYTEFPAHARVNFTGNSCKSCCLCVSDPRACGPYAAGVAVVVMGGTGVAGCATAGVPVVGPILCMVGAVLSCGCCGYLRKLSHAAQSNSTFYPDTR